MQFEGFPRRGKYKGSHAYTNPLDNRPNGKPLGLFGETIASLAVKVQEVHDAALVDIEVALDLLSDASIGSEQPPELDI